ATGWAPPRSRARSSTSARTGPRSLGPGAFVPYVGHHHKPVVPDELVVLLVGDQVALAEHDVASEAALDGLHDVDVLPEDEVHGALREQRVRELVLLGVGLVLVLRAPVEVHHHEVGALLAGPGRVRLD